MAKSLKSDKWFVRVDGNEEWLKTKLNIIAHWIDTQAIFGIYHLGDKEENPHCHFVIHTSTTQKQSFALRIKNLFDIEKRTQYAIDVWDGVKVGGAVAYMFHEKDRPILVSRGFTEEEISLAQAAHQATEKVVDINKKKSSGKLVDKALAHFENQEVERIDILQYMLKEIHSGGSYYPGEYRLKSFVEEVMVRRLDPRGLARYAREMEQRLWREA